MVEIQARLNAAWPSRSPRAAAYRQRAQQLTQIAASEWREDVRRQMLDQAVTYERAADAMAPASEVTERGETFGQMQ